MEEKVKQDMATEIEKLAVSFLSKNEIIIILEIDVALHKLLDIKSHLWCKAYERGRLKSKAEVNAKIIELAKEGSVPAQEMALKIIKDSNSD